MATDDVAVVRGAFEAFAERGLEAVLEFLAPDIEWSVRADLPDAQTYHGLDAMPGLFARFTDVLDEIWMQPEELIPVGDGEVMAPLRWGGRGRGSGVEIEESRETWVLKVREGKIARVREYATKGEALAEVRSGDQ